MKPLQITQSSFDSEVLNSPLPVLVDFWAEWCGPCKMLAPTLDQIATDYAGKIKIAKVNVDENPELGQRFRIQSLPTLLFFVDGQPVKQLLGAAARKTITSTLDEILQNEKQLK